MVQLDSPCIVSYLHDHMKYNTIIELNHSITETNWGIHMQNLKYTQTVFRLIILNKIVSTCRIWELMVTLFYRSNKIKKIPVHLQFVVPLDVPLLELINILKLYIWDWDACNS